VRSHYILLLLLLFYVELAQGQQPGDRQIEFSIEVGTAFPVLKGGRKPENLLSYEREGVGGTFRLVIPVSNQWLLSLRAGGMDYKTSNDFNVAILDSFRDNYYVLSGGQAGTLHNPINAGVGYRLELGSGYLAPEVSLGFTFIELDGTSARMKRKGSNEEYEFSLLGAGKSGGGFTLSVGAHFVYPLTRSGGINLSISPQLFFARERLDVIYQFEGLGGKKMSYPHTFRGTLTAFCLYAGVSFSPATCCWSIPAPSTDDLR
jgi:hypothetical protein